MELENASLWLWSCCWSPPPVVGAQWSHEGGALEATEGSESLQQEQNCWQWLKSFSKDPQKWDEVLGENKLSSAPQGVTSCSCSRAGAWTRQSRGLLRGEGKRWTYQCSITSWISMTGEALRQFLWAYCLPREDQKIDQAVRKPFACGYCRCHPGIIQSTDACYVLSFTRDNARTSQAWSICGYEPAQQVRVGSAKELIWNF